MVLMALDHSRDFFGDIRIPPENVATTTTVLFFTRWVTHLCAPTFLLLAGASAWLHGQKLQNRTELSKFLITRGLWLLFLEFTVVRFALLFSLTLGPWFFIVIAAIGSSMVLLGVACWLPDRAVLGLGIAIVCGHNLLDAVSEETAASLGWLWTALLRPGYIPSANMAVGYPILPWFGVMALGYGLSPWLAQSPEKRKAFAFRLGLIFFATFLALRIVNVYGDPQPWEQQPVAQTAAGAEETSSTEVDWMRTSFSFLATAKYPPSLLFVLMTLGVSLLLLSLFEQLGSESGPVRFLKVFGSVPLFFYILHFYLLHLGAWAIYWVRKGVLISPMHIDAVEEVPPEYGFNGPYLSLIHI